MTTDAKVQFVEGKIVITASLGLPEVAASVVLNVSPKTLLDEIAAKIGGPIPAEIAQFLENALGLK